MILIHDMDIKSSKKQIILIVVRLLSIHGGYYSFLYNLLPELGNSGYKVVLVIITTLEMRDSIISKFPNTEIKFIQQPSLNNILPIFSLYRIVAVYKPRKIIVNDLFESLFVYPYKVFHKHVQVYVIVHSTLRDMPDIGKARIWWIYNIHKVLQALVTKYVSVSRYGAGVLEKGGIDQKRITVIPNGYRSFNSDNQEKKLQKQIQIGFVGRLSSEKGPDIFMDVAEICKELPIDFVMFGTGPEESRICKRLLTVNNCKLITDKSNPEEIYNKLDIVILPSRTEGQPYTVLEAFAYNVVVIGSAAGGLPELLNGNGIIVESNEPREYRQLLLELIENREAMRTLTKKAAEYIQHSGSRQVMGEQYLKLFEQ